MRKIYYSILFLTLTFSIVTAKSSKVSFFQDNDYKISGWTKFIENMSMSKWKPGVKVGINLHEFKNSESTSDNTKYREGYNFGVFIDYTSEYFIFQPGLNYFSKGSKISIPDTEWYSGTNWTIRLNYIEVPLRIGVTVFKHRLGGVQPVRINTTPYFAYALNGKFVGKSVTSKINFGNGINDLKRIDYGIKLGMSIVFGSFEPSFGYDLGLCNIGNNNAKPANNRGFYFTVAMVFGK